MSDIWQLTSRTALKTDVAYLAAAALRDCHTQARQERAWRHLLCVSPEDLHATLEEADSLHERSELFDDLPLPGAESDPMDEEDDEAQGNAMEVYDDNPDAPAAVEEHSERQ